MLRNQLRVEGSMTERFAHPCRLIVHARESGGIEILIPGKGYWLLEFRICVGFRSWWGSL